MGAYDGKRKNEDDDFQPGSGDADFVDKPGEDLFYDNTVTLCGRLHFKDTLKISHGTFGDFASFQLLVVRKRPEGKESKHYLYVKVFNPSFLETLSQLPLHSFLKISGQLESFNGRMYINARQIFLLPGVDKMRDEIEEYRKSRASSDVQSEIELSGDIMEKIRGQNSKLLQGYFQDTLVDVNVDATPQTNDPEIEAEERHMLRQRGRLDSDGPRRLNPEKTISMDSVHKTFSGSGMEPRDSYRGESRIEPPRKRLPDGPDDDDAREDSRESDDIKSDVQEIEAMLSCLKEFEDNAGSDSDRDSPTYEDTGGNEFAAPATPDVSMRDRMPDSRREPEMPLTSYPERREDAPSQERDEISRLWKAQRTNESNDSEKREPPKKSGWGAKEKPRRFFGRSSRN